MCSKLHRVLDCVFICAPRCAHVYITVSVIKHFANIAIMDTEAMVLSFSTNGNSREKIQFKFTLWW